MSSFLVTYFSRVLGRGRGHGITAHFIIGLLVMTQRRAIQEKYSLFIGSEKQSSEEFLETTTTTEATTLDPSILLNQFEQPFIWQSKRLPTVIQPTEYILYINTATESWRTYFTGRVEIKFTVAAETDIVVLHFSNPKELQTDSIKCKDSQNTQKQFLVTEITYTSPETCHERGDGPRCMLAIHFEASLAPGMTCSVVMDFSAPIRYDSTGFFYDDYHSVDSNQSSTSYALVTQMEPTFARKAFPCLDEPTFKAEFSLTFTYDPKVFDFVLFNTRLRDEDSVKNLKVAYFEKSVSMSTYLVGIIAAKNYEMFSKTAAPTALRNYPVLHRIYAPSDFADFVEGPLDLAIESMVYFENKFALGFPMDKCDHFPVEDLKLFGMENWGVITYSMYNMLYDPENFGIEYEVSMSSVVAHEMAHQWFGNLVTLEFWDDLWLNEGFATFMSYVALQQLKPQLQMKERFYTDDKLLMALQMDSFQSSHPIVMSSDTGLFDKITYWKGCAVLSMLEDAIGSDRFIEGVRQYLAKFQYGNANSADLWHMLTLASDGSFGDIGQLTNSWVSQKHVPLVNVSFDDSAIFLEQSAFCYSCKQDQSKAWTIPLTYFFSNQLPGGSQTFIMSEKSAVVEFDRARPDWVKFNRHGTGIYRILYSNPEALDNFASTIVKDANHKAKFPNTQDSQLILPYMERGNLYIDLITSAKLGYLSYRSVIEFVDKVLPHEKSVGALKLLFNQHFGLGDLFQRVDRSGYKHLTQKFVMKHLGAKYAGFDESSWAEDESDLNRFNLKMLCSAGFEQCLEDSRNYFAKWREDESSLTFSADLKLTIFAAISRYGTYEDWEYMYNKASGANGRKEDFNLYQLWYTRDSVLIRRLLTEQFISDGQIHGDTTRAITSMFWSAKKNLPGAYVAWDIIRTNWDLLWRVFGEMDFLGDLLTTLYNNFDTTGQLHELLYAGATLDHFSTSPSYSEGLESIAFNIEWNEMHLDDVILILQELTD